MLEKVVMVSSDADHSKDIRLKDFSLNFDNEVRLGEGFVYYPLGRRHVVANFCRSPGYIESDYQNAIGGVSERSREKNVAIRTQDGAVYKFSSRHHVVREAQTAVERLYSQAQQLQ